jgi:hypothetical protein
MRQPPRRATAQSAGRRARRAAATARAAGSTGTRWRKSRRSLAFRAGRGASLTEPIHGPNLTWRMFPT